MGRRDAGAGCGVFFLRPGLPRLYGERMQDAEMVAAIVAGQTAGLAAAYDRYAPALHAYCRSMLGEPADAADAVQDTFIIAAAKLGGLRDPDRLRPWLYSVARNECHRRLRSRVSSAPLEEAGEMTDQTVDLSAHAERAELRALVGAALGGLNPGDREIIELSLRHELSGADLADMLGVSPNQAHALASRARTQFETSLGALLVARTGRESCPELDAMLTGWDGEMTVLLRKRINRHVERCDICGARRRRELSPAALLSMLPVVLLPAGLRDQIFRLVADVSPSASAYRAQVVRRAGPFGRSGFPQPLGVPHVGRGGKSYALAAGAGVAALLVIGGGIVFAADMLHHSPPGPSTVAAGPASDPPATPSGPVAATVTPTASASTHTSSAPPLAPPAASPAPAATTPAAPRPTPTHSKTPAPTPTPTPGTLTVPPTPVQLAQDATTQAGPYLGTFSITASGGPVKFHIVNPYPLALTVRPLNGKLVANATVVIHLSAPAVDPALPYQTTLTVNPGGILVQVEYPPSG